MRATEIKITDKLYEVVGWTDIRKHPVKLITYGSISDFKRGKPCIIVKSKSDHEYLAEPNSNVFTNIRWGYLLFTTLEAAQKHQLRMRKKEEYRKYQAYKKARNEYEEFKREYRNKPASNVIDEN